MSKTDYDTIIFWYRDKYPESTWLDVRKYLMRCCGIHSVTANRKVKFFEVLNPCALDVGDEVHLTDPEPGDEEEVQAEMVFDKIDRPENVEGDEVEDDPRFYKPANLMTDEEVLIELRNELIKEGRSAKWPKDRNAARKELRRLLESANYQKINSSETKLTPRGIAAQIDALIFGTSPARIEQIYGIEDKSKND